MVLCYNTYCDKIQLIKSFERCEYSDIGLGDFFYLLVQKKV